jgi:hypothetical protein
MRATSSRVAAVAALIALMAAACGGGGNNKEPSPSGSAAEARFSQGDLARVVLGRSEPPDGYKFAHSFAGGDYSPGLFAIPVDPQGGYVKGYVGGLENEFIPKGSTATPTGLKYDGAIDSGAMFYRDDATAAKAFRLQAQDYGSRKEVEGGIEPVRDIPAEGLGEESFGLRGSFYGTYGADFDFVLYAWRVSNLVQYVYGWGPEGKPHSADQAEMLRVARTTFSLSRLQTIVLSPSEAPPGTAYQGYWQGPSSIAVLTSELSQGRYDVPGLVDGYHSGFFNDVSTEKRGLDSIALLFGSGRDASTALRLLRRDAVDSSAGVLQPFAAESLGIEHFALRGKESAALVRTFYAWRVGPLVLWVSDWNFPTSEALNAARVMDSRR